MANKGHQHKERILELRAKGKTYSEIQEETGASKGTISFHCGEGQKDKTKERTKRARTKLSHRFRDIKEERGCKDCGKEYPHWILDFDHLPQHKKRGSPLHIASRYGLEAGLEELKKCDVVCSNCHRQRTWERNQSGYKV